MGIVVIAALMVEVISIVRFQTVRREMAEEMEIHGQVVLNAMTEQIEHLLEITENTMKENLWVIQRSLVHPDSTSRALIYLIDDNPNVVGSSLAFVPDYYPSKGRLYEPYAHKESDGSIVLSQIAGPDYDYTRNDGFVWTSTHMEPYWTDPYVYGPDSLGYATYSFPVKDAKGRLAAICGLDITLSWLGDTLNALQSYPSSFGLILTKDGKLVAGPSEERATKESVQLALDLFHEKLFLYDYPDISLRKSEMSRLPYWQVVQVFNSKVFFSRLRKLRYQQGWLILLGLAVLAFMINLYARSEIKLRVASEEKARIDGELEVARRIQREMLPKTFPPFLYGSLEPAQEVGGDLFDYFTRDGKLFFCIGDVSGKGVPSAMLMSVAHSIFRLVAQKADSPSKVLSTMNNALCHGNDSNMFMTFFVGCLDLYSGELIFGNAGHDKPFLLTDEVTPLLTKAQLPLGVFPQTHFEEQSCMLSPGTTLLLYTDGLTEAMNAERKQLGKEGVLAVLKRFQSGTDPSLSHLVASLSEAVHDFAGEAPQSDDLTMLAIRFAPEHVMRSSLELGNDVNEVPRLNAFVKDFCAGLEIPGKMAAGLRLAVEETVVNVINYAYPEGEKGAVLVQADSNGEEVRFTITDSGAPFDPTSVLEPDTTLDVQDRPIGGLGILLTRKLMDSISYVRKNGKNVLSLTKSII